MEAGACSMSVCVCVCVCCGLAAHGRPASSSDQSMLLVVLGAHAACVKTSIAKHDQPRGDVLCQQVEHPAAPARSTPPPRCAHTFPF